MAKPLFNAVVRIKHTGNGVAATAPEVIGADGAWHPIAATAISERTGTHGTTVTLRMSGRIEWIDVGPEKERHLVCDMCEHTEPTLDLAGQDCPSCGAGTMTEEEIAEPVPVP
jgi:hypothetical protein